MRHTDLRGQYRMFNSMGTPKNPVGVTLEEARDLLRHHGPASLDELVPLFWPHLPEPDRARCRIVASIIATVLLDLQWAECRAGLYRAVG